MPQLVCFNLNAIVNITEIIKEKERKENLKTKIYFVLKK